MNYAVGCASAASCVAFGAAGGHKHTWTQYQKDLYQKSNYYHFMNSVGLIVGGLIPRQRRNISPFFFATGILLFSGPLYHKAWFLDDSEKFYTQVTPIGGTAMIIGWLLLMIRF